MEAFESLCDMPASVQQAKLKTLRSRAPRWLAELEAMLAADADEGTLPAAQELATLAQSAVNHVAELLDAARPPPARAGDVIDDRYIVTEQLGSGATSEVYLATDTHTQASVALKVLRAEYASRTVERRFEREYRTIASIQHPGVLRVHALGRWGERRYIVMEVVRGDLRSFAGADLDILLPLLARVCFALDQVHQRGIVHRDLKPANVLIESAESGPKLADFGVIRMLNQEDASASTDPGAIIGTVDYLSPEQVSGRPVDPRSDLFALGCMMFELTTGQMPFQGNVYERLHRRVSQRAPSLAELRPSAGPRLVELVGALLEPLPEHRPASAWEVALELQEIAGDADEGRADASDAHATETSRYPSSAWLFSSGCVGREAELATLLKQSERSRGATGVSAIVGPPGMGKTTLAQALEHQLRDAGWTAHWARLAPDDPTPFAPFTALLGDSWAEERAIEGQSGTRNPHGNEGRGRARRQLVDALLERLHKRARGRPLALVLEDMHDAGRDALELVQLLTTAATESAGLELWVVITLRPNGLPSVSRALPSADILRVEPLNAAEVERVVAQVLGVPVTDVPSGVGHRVTERAEGSPLLAVSALRAMVSAGALIRERGGWREDGDPSRPLDAEISMALSTRLQSLSPSASHLLSVASLFGRSLDTDLLRLVTEATVGAIDDAIDSGMRSGVLRLDAQGDVRFEHALISDELTRRLDPLKRARYHDRAAAELSTRANNDVLVAWHVARGSDASAAVAAAESAAADALAAHDYSLAAAFTTTAIGRAQEYDGPTHTLEENLADALVPLGEVERSLALYVDLEESASDVLTRVRIMRKRGLAMLRTERSGAAIDVLRAALRLAGGRIPAARPLQVIATVRDLIASQLRRVWPRRRTQALEIERATVQRELALLHRWIDLYASAAYVAGFTRLAERMDPAQFRIDAYGFDAFFFAVLGNAPVSRHFERAGLELARREADTIGLMRMELTRGGTDLLIHGDVASSRARMQAGVALAEQTCDDFSLAFAYNSQAWGYALVGSMTDAIASLEHAEEHGHAAQAQWIVTDTRLLRAYVAGVHGDTSESEVAARDVLQSDIRLAFPVFDALATEVVAGCAMVRGDLHEAVTTYERAKAIYESKGLERGWGLLVSMSHIEALCSLADEVGLDQVPDFRARLKHSVVWTRKWLRGRGLYAGCYEMTRGVLAARDGQVARAQSDFARVRHIRAGVQQTYIDTWLRARMALEQRRMGIDTVGANAELDRVGLQYERWQMHGMGRWLARHRERTG